MAVYVPDVDGIPAAELIELLGWELADRFTEAENVLLAEVARRAQRIILLEAKGTETADVVARARIMQELAVERAAALRSLRDLSRKVVADLREQDLAEWLVNIAAEEGSAAAAARLRLARRLPRAITLTGSATQAVGMLILDLSNRLAALEQRILRYPQDVYQQVISETAPFRLLGVQMSVINQRAAVQSFLSKGITGFVDRSDRRWTIGSYAEMAGRTATSRAWNDAGVWRMQQSGINLVTVIGSFDACRKCAPWIGKILSTDGATGTIILPHAIENRAVTVTIAGTVEEAKAAGWNHPNCRDHLAAYLPGLSVPQSDFEYNEAAEKERAKQRELERDVRAAKRDEATAMDDISRAKAHKAIREGQAALRDFTSETGRLRQSYREQLHFADGRKPS
ncbi:phage minor capsid protein [Plantibacter sp. YIM 135249]|uniref:phage minor capsid protein n=1 Tax=Plantibacter sp. YIM 135249 TaxID=3423918 RepID=UPI003D327C7A